MLGRIDGKYKGAGFIFLFDYDIEGVPTGQILCAERKNQGMAFEGEPGSYCQKIFKATPVPNAPSARLYALP